MVSNHHPLVFQTSATDRVSYRPEIVPNRIELLLSAYQTDFLPLEDGTISGQGWTRTNDVSVVGDLQSLAFAARLPTQILMGSCSQWITPSHDYRLVIVVHSYSVRIYVASLLRLCRLGFEPRTT